MAYNILRQVVLYRNIYFFVHLDRVTYNCIWEKNDLGLQIKIQNSSELCPLTLLIVTENAEQTVTCICCQPFSDASIADPQHSLQLALSGRYKK
jgi:hypothetical protein